MTTADNAKSDPTFDDYIAASEELDRIYDQLKGLLDTMPGIETPDKARISHHARYIRLTHTYLDKMHNMMIDQFNYLNNRIDGKH